MLSFYNKMLLNKSNYTRLTKLYEVRVVIVVYFHVNIYDYHS